jgi:hypothetical protein
MTGSEIPLRMQTARLLGVTASRREGTLLLYPDKLAHVSSPAFRWGTSAGFVTVFIVSFALTGTGPGALGALIGGVAGWMIGAAIAKSQAPGKVAAGGDGVTVIPLDSITSLQTCKSTGVGGWLRRQSLLVTTATGVEYRFGAKLAGWSADLASALTARGSGVSTTPQGITVAPAPHA